MCEENEQHVDETEVSPELQDFLPPEPLPGKRRKNVVRALGIGLLTLGGCGLMLISIPTRTAGTTVSARVRKVEHRLDGLEVLDEAPAADDRLAAEAAQPPEH